MIKQIQIFLGPARVQAFIILLGLTGLISLILNAVRTPANTWVTPVQTLMVVIFLVGTAIIFGGRLRQEERLRWASILAPSVGAILLGFTVLPNLLLPLLGAAAGWVVAGAFLFRRRVPKEYQDAIKFLRKGQYEESVNAMDGLIKDEPDNENYYRFRAEVFRIWGKLDRAKKDYTQMAEVPESAVAYNGLAEVYLQSGQYIEAQRAGQRAYELAPDEWVAAYNLGMIEDRLKTPDDAIEHLNKAMSLKVPDVRHRLLIHLYLARAYARKGDLDAAQRELDLIKRHKNGLEEWQNLLEHPEAATLRAVLEGDIRTAQDLIDGKVDLKALAGSSI